MEQDIESTEHGIQAAYYSSDGVSYRPVIECRCGESWREFNWEDAGAELDAHLKEVSE